MRNLKELEILGNVHRIIKTKKSGCVRDLAKSIGISKSCFHKYVDQIKIMGGEIVYCRISQHYYYAKDFKLIISIETNSMKQIFGGNSFFFNPRFMDSKVLNL